MPNILRDTLHDLKRLITAWIQQTPQGQKFADGFRRGYWSTVAKAQYRNQQKELE